MARRVASVWESGSKIFQDCQWVVLVKRVKPRLVLISSLNTEIPIQDCHLRVYVSLVASGWPLGWCSRLNFGKKKISKSISDRNAEYVHFIVQLIGNYPQFPLVKNVDIS